MILVSQNSRQQVPQAPTTAAGTPRSAPIEPLRPEDHSAANHGLGNALGATNALVAVPAHVTELDNQLNSAIDPSMVNALIQAHIYRSSPEAQQEALTFLSKPEYRERYRNELNLIQAKAELAALRRQNGTAPAPRTPRKRFKPSPVVTSVAGATAIGFATLALSRNWRWSIVGLLVGGLVGYGVGSWELYKAELEEA